MFPNDKTTFFYMTRRDIVAQASSYATAKATGVWHHFSNKPRSAATSQGSVLTDESIWREIILLLEAEMQMEGFFTRRAIDPIRIDYEMLIASRRDVLATVLLNIGCDVESIIATASQIVDRTDKMPGDYFAQLLAFRRRYAGLLADVQRARGSNYNAVRQSLRQSGFLS